MNTDPDPPVDRFCDLVMKGGITSGVVYPRAISFLSRHYRFHSIGGTSAGAIAAVLTAAAEYRRRQTGSWEGFRALEKLPEELQEVLPGTKKSKLLSLFQPQPGTRRLFEVLITSLNSEGTLRRIAWIAFGFLKAYWPATLASLLIALSIGWWGASWFTSALVLLFALLISIGGWVYFDFTRRVVENGFGLCTGMSSDKDIEALTPWLHHRIQTAAGEPLNKPLTFGDLWSADKNFPPSWLQLPATPKPRAIDLQMFSTNLSHGRPYIFPLPEPDANPTRFRVKERLFFKREELARYLPGDVLETLCVSATPYQIDSDRKGIDPDEAAATGALELPEARHFPVLLAARMSLSFPLLFAAVPLYAIDHEVPRGRRTFRRCWFSDGGICSNFPMHLFDGLVPRWPTFGIKLEPEIKGRDPVYLPQRYATGYGESWNLFAQRDKSASQFGGFVSAIIGTMQNWNDNALGRMPGVRDRIARVRLKNQEGGLNLNMTPELIKGLARRGEEAAQQLVQRFTAASPDGPQKPGWDEHRLVRLNVLLKMIQARTPAVERALSASTRHATDYATLIEKAASLKDPNGNPVAPAGYEEPLTADQRDALDKVVKALGDLSKTLAEPANANPFKPIPNPELRVRPPL